MEPDGLLAAGGDLDRATLMRAYARGIFPWYSTGQPILWWCPAERSVITPGEIKISRSLKKTIKRGNLEIKIDHNFPAVINACAAPRAQQSGTWITAEMQHAYIELHQHGEAHSVECYRDRELVGGLYGIAIGQAFFGESMFSRVNDASKVALVALSDYLQHWGYRLIDCQIHNPHLASMGARQIPRSEFLECLASVIDKTPLEHAWQNALPTRREEH